MLKEGKPLDSTTGRTDLTGVGGGDLSPFGQAGVANIGEIRALTDYNKSIYGANNPAFKSSAQSLDIFEWDLKPSQQGSGGSGATGGTGSVDGGSATVTPIDDGTGTGGSTDSGGTGGTGTGGTGFTHSYNRSYYPVYDQGKTGVSEVKMPDYTGGITKQEADFLC